MTRLPLLELIWTTIYEKDTNNEISNEDLVFMYNTLATKFNEAIEEFENRGSS